MKAFIIILMIMIFAGAGAAGLFAVYHLPWHFEETSPIQPIAFSHKIHAGEHEIHCLYCHAYAEISKSAGVPDMETCKNCHSIISRDKPEVKKVMEYWKNKEPIPWIKVHDLPDHVYFPHKMHLQAGLQCGRCHGDVASMERVERVSSLKMGWCLNCHKENQASIDCWTCHM